MASPLSASPSSRFRMLPCAPITLVPPLADDMFLPASGRDGRIARDCTRWRSLCCCLRNATATFLAGGMLLAARLKNLPPCNIIAGDPAPTSPGGRTRRNISPREPPFSGRAVLGRRRGVDERVINSNRPQTSRPTHNFSPRTLHDKLRKESRMGLPESVLILGGVSYLCVKRYHALRFR